MQIELRSKGILMTDELRGFVEKKLRSALGRFRHRVHRVQLRLTDINGPKGGEDIHCLIRASLGSSQFVNINETRGDTFSAVSRASERAGRHLSRHLSRMRTKRRGK